MADARGVICGPPAAHEEIMPSSGFGVGGEVYAAVEKRCSWVPLLRSCRCGEARSCSVLVSWDVPQQFSSQVPSSKHRSDSTVGDSELAPRSHIIPRSLSLRSPLRHGAHVSGEPGRRKGVLAGADDRFPASVPFVTEMNLADEPLQGHSDAGQ
ncbi:hypothetical protein SKAU_G00299910 [Synaphobranchus kaupii]|uniref:Uncharacterized protein n=1 Tax=Synaphobranchus kaupii TaxID=118154 RepID=A0A9Q1EVG6_SYNKA|nr:hypothetical protein SKAU_G00299910 [Synaphobranchus kaupii]